jgi:L,D-peptidoglycan transpeptidase YkuD (ErfK/YbiS/YcfS/YnhG family)
MKKIYCLCILEILLMQPSARNTWCSGDDPLRDSRQVLIVSTADWDSAGGVMQRYERTAPGEEWTPVGNPIAVVVGRNGMAWGRGLHTLPPDAAPIKKEGDGKSPAGIFGFSHAFGLAPSSDYSAIKIPYLQVTSAIECVDDATSAYYNQIVDAGAVACDWSSSEKMAEYSHEYRLGLVVQHNTDPIAKGGGSCIFLHIWKNQESGTAGCTAMSEADLVEVVNWIDSAKNPLLIQLPKNELKRYAKEWSAPVESAAAQ